LNKSEVGEKGAKEKIEDKGNSVEGGKS